MIFCQRANLLRLWPYRAHFVPMYSLAKLFFFFLAYKRKYNKQLRATYINESCCLEAQCVCLAGCQSWVTTKKTKRNTQWHDAIHRFALAIDCYTSWCNVSRLCWLIQEFNISFLRKQHSEPQPQSGCQQNCRAGFIASTCERYGSSSTLESIVFLGAEFATRWHSRRPANWCNSRVRIDLLNSIFTLYKSSKLCKLIKVQQSCECVLFIYFS